jgi:hypothetical protein
MRERLQVRKTGPVSHFSGTVIEHSDPEMPGAPMTGANRDRRRNHFHRAIPHSDFGLIIRIFTYIQTDCNRATNGISMRLLRVRGDCAGKSLLPVELSARRWALLDRDAGAAWWEHDRSSHRVQLNRQRGGPDLLT